jgi:hypothetical protein
MRYVVAMEGGKQEELKRTKVVEEENRSQGGCGREVVVAHGRRKEVDLRCWLLE